MLYARVVITDLDGDEHTITPSGMGDTDVLDVEFTHKAADDFVFTIGDQTGTIKDWLKRGCTAKVYIDTASTPTTLKLHGMVEEVTLVQPVPGFVLLKAEGREVFHVVINNRIVTETYLDTEVSAIVRDLLWKYAPYPDDTVLALSFYEGTGLTVHDESKYENDGAITGASWVDGKYGKALNFDGVNDYASCGPNIIMTPVSIVTVEGWVYIDLALTLEDMDPTAMIMNVGVGVMPEYQASTKRLQTEVKFVIAGTRTPGYTIPSTGWYHFAFTFNGTYYAFYVNGVLRGSGTIATDTINYTNAYVYMGGWTTAQSFKGIVDEACILNCALTPDEIMAHATYPYLHDIDVTATTPEDIRFPYRPLNECLEELAALSGYSYLGNPNTVMLWKEEASEDSGFTYDETNIEATPEVIETLLPIKNRVYVIGGNYMQVDQQQLVHDASKNVWEKWRAQSFTPARSDLDQVSLYLKRTGDPANLEGEIRTDDPGNGPDVKVATFTIDADFIGTTASWRPVTVEATLLIEEKYWIVLKKTGDAGNNYEWYDDDDVAGENAESNDGVTWLVNNGGSYQFAFKTHYTIPILAVASDYAHKEIYKWRETVIEDKSIMSRTLARETAQAKLSDLKDMTAQIRDIYIGNVTGIPELGKLVTITLANLGISAVQYVAKEAKIKFKGGEHGTFHLDLRLGREASELAEWLRDLKSEVDRTKVGAFGVEWGLINLVRGLSDTAEATDANLVGTVQLSGTFEIGTARIGFSDIG